MEHTCHLRLCGSLRLDQDSRPAWAKKKKCLWNSILMENCVVGHSYGGKHKQKDQVESGLGKKWNLTSKITRAKRAGAVAQMVECLCSKFEALTSNPNTTPQKRKISESHPGIWVNSGILCEHSPYIFSFQIIWSWAIFRIKFNFSEKYLYCFCL
jgi:hypothetical protein